MFSKATIVETLNLIEPQSHTVLTNMFMKYGIPNDVHYSGSSKLGRLNSVAKYLIENPNLEGILSDSLHFEIIEEIINFCLENDLYDEENRVFENSKILYRLLRRDGYTICDNKLIRELNSVLDIEKEENMVDKLLLKHNFSVAQGHLNQALDAYTRDDWAASNSQLRTYIEELTKTMAERITGKVFSNSHEARSELARIYPAIFYTELNEWVDNNGVGYFNGFWKRLHPHGSHPGLSDENDCIFRINLVLVSSAEILRRYDANY